MKTFTSLAVIALSVSCGNAANGRNSAVHAVHEEAGAGGPPGLAGFRLGMVSVFIPTAAPTPACADSACLKRRQSALFDQARDWYRDVLGFQVMRDYPLDVPGTAGRWLQMNLPQQPDLSLVFKAGQPITGNAVLTIFVPDDADLCAYRKHLKARNVTFAMEPTRDPWAFEMMIRDLNGQPIVVSVPKKPGQAQAATSCDD